MATYVISDIHGAYNRLMDVLYQAKFDETKDVLYCLGDLTDRLPNSGKVLEWAYNAGSWFKPLLGNHEDMYIVYFKEQKEYINWILKNYPEDEERQQDLIYNYFYNSLWATNGGLKTWEFYMSLPKVIRDDYLDWIQRWPLYYDIDINGRRFVLVHAGLAMRGIRMSDDSYRKGLDSYVEIKDFPTQWSQSLLWIRNNWFYDNTELPCDVIFGHTPSTFVYQELLDLNDWIEIDGGEPVPIETGKEILHFGTGLKKHCIDSGRQVLSLLRLDDMEEFTSDIEENDEEED